LIRHASFAELSFPCLEYVMVNYQCSLIVQEKNIYKENNWLIF